MDTRKVKQLVQLMRKLGVTELSTQDITLKLGPIPVKLDKNPAPAGTELAGGSFSPPGELSEDDVLFWSTPQL